MKNPSKFLGNERKYLDMVLESESWSATSGSWTEKLELEFARKFESKYSIAVVEYAFASSNCPALTMALISSPWARDL